MIRGKVISVTTWVALAITMLTQANAEETKKDIYLHQIQDVSGFAFNAQTPDIFSVSTPHGIFSVEQNGLATQLNTNQAYFTELVSHPTNPSILFTSGFKSKTEKLGVLRSNDGGKTWEKISDKDTAFYVMAINSADPNILYGVDEDIQISRDGGKNWTKTSDLPGDRVFDLAISPRNNKTIYAATFKGLFVSKDGGVSWEDKGPQSKPMSSIQITPSGDLHAFIYDYGYITANENKLEWSKPINQFQHRALLNITLDPNNEKRIYAVADTGAVVVSKDKGLSWGSFEGFQYTTPDRISKGKVLFEDNCIACHGAQGVGEKPNDPSAVDEEGLPFAPALNDSTHAWHHSDEQLMSTIMNGSPRNERMIAWKEQGISKEDSESIVAYIKSLWNFTSLSCQGPRHMSCMN